MNGQKIFANVEEVQIFANKSNTSNMIHDEYVNKLNLVWECLISFNFIWGGGQARKPDINQNNCKRM